MPIAKVGIAPLEIITPNLADASVVYTDSSVLPLVIAADPSVVRIVLSQDAVQQTLTTFTVVGGSRQFAVTLPLDGNTDTIQVTGYNNDPTNSADTNNANPLMTPVFQFTAQYQQSNLGVRVTAPSGVTVYKGLNTCRIEWVTPSVAGFIGVRVQYSTDAAGINPAFATYGSPVTDVSRTADQTTNTPTVSVASVAVTNVIGVDTQTTTTTVAQSVTVDFSSATLPTALVSGSPFYVMLTTLVQDPDTNVVYESVASGPFLCGFVDLRKVAPTDFPAQQRVNDIATRLISEITRRNPTLDLTARAELRDVIINPLALELSNQSIREWFAHACQSISALATIDDQDGDGISDTIASSTYKQQIKQAFSLSDADTQTLIDGRFDVLGEQAGVPRGGATQSVVPLTFFTYTRPTTLLTVPLGLVVSTIPDADNTDTVSFQTTATGSIDPAALSSYYDAVNGWWSVNVAAQCTVAGAVGAVGAGTVRQVTTGSVGLSVTNLKGSRGASDEQSNADYAAMIQDRIVTGRDSSSRNAYKIMAQQVPGVTSANVVAAGDLDMVRDWAPTIQKHVYGCVDVYVRGITDSQQTEEVPFQYPTYGTKDALATYAKLQLLDASTLRFGISPVQGPIMTAVELVSVSAGRTLYLDCTNAQFDSTGATMWLDPLGQVYTVADGIKTPWVSQGSIMTNQQFLRAATSNNVVYSVMLRLQQGINHTPALQPVSKADTVTGDLTGAISQTLIRSVYTNDFLLTGGSNQSGDRIVVDATTSTLTVKSLVITGTTTQIDVGMDVAVDGNGKPLALTSVRSADQSVLYEFGVDYTIVATGRYRSYGITILQKNEAPAITTGTTVLLGYKHLDLTENLTLQAETVSMVGVVATPLTYQGFIRNVWLPETYGNTTLSQDGYNADPTQATGLVAAGVPYASRYIKATYSDGTTTTTLVEGQDFTLNVDANLNATITRIVGGHIPDGAAVSVQYFTVEVFTIASEYPTYVQQVADVYAANPTACVSVVVKAVVESAVDITAEIVLEPSADADTVDSRIRTAMSLLMDRSGRNLGQDDVVAALKAVVGVDKVTLPLQKCAKSDGAYDIGFIVPTGTSWVSLTSDAAFANRTVSALSFITSAPVLQNPTLPGGGDADNYVGLLYEGEAYARMPSIAAFLNASSPSFYIIGTGDQIDAYTTLNSTYAGRILLKSPATVPDPSARAYRVTYQVYGATGTQDISVANTETLEIGNLTLLYRSA